jgi:hypothetical protein
MPLPLPDPPVRELAMLPILSPQAADIGLTVITGWTGEAIAWAQRTTGDDSPFQHTFGVVDDQGNTAEAMPGYRGARHNHVAHYDHTRTVYIRVAMTEAQRYTVGDEWQSMLGTRYSYVQYPALGILAGSEKVADWTGRPRVEMRPQWLTGYIARSNRLICSQYVDEGAARHDVHFFTNGRAPGDVTPGDFWCHLDVEHFLFLSDPITAA